MTLQVDFYLNHVCWYANNWCVFGPSWIFSGLQELLCHLLTLCTWGKGTRTKKLISWLNYWLDYTYLEMSRDICSLRTAAALTWLGGCQGSQIGIVLSSEVAIALIWIGWGRTSCGLPDSFHYSRVFPVTVNKSKNVNWLNIGYQTQILYHNLPASTASWSHATLATHAWSIYIATAICAGRFLCRQDPFCDHATRDCEYIKVTFLHLHFRSYEYSSG